MYSVWNPLWEEESSWVKVWIDNALTVCNGCNRSHGAESYGLNFYIGNRFYRHSVWNFPYEEESEMVGGKRATVKREARPDSSQYCRTKEEGEGKKTLRLMFATSDPRGACPGALEEVGEKAGKLELFSRHDALLVLHAVRERKIRGLTLIR